VGTLGTARGTKSLHEEPEEALERNLRNVLVVRVPDVAFSDLARSSGARDEDGSGPVVAVVADSEDGEDVQLGDAEYVRRLFSDKHVLTGVVHSAEMAPLKATTAGETAPHAKATSRPARIALRTNGKTVFVDIASVNVVRAQGNYVQLQTPSRSYLLRESVSTVANRLQHFGFVRIHRSTIVNASLVEEIRTARSGEIRLRLRGTDKEYCVSRRYRGVLKSLAACWI
jgi:DNA-binding LytR/AlgR family response regulator